MSTQKSNRYHNFGLALQESLLRIGETPSWLARVTGKDKGQISKYINGKLVPKRVTQIELLTPTGFDIKEVDGQWELVLVSNTEDLVKETTIDYSVNDLKKEIGEVEEIFSELLLLSELFKEIVLNKEQAENQKTIQLEMIKEKLAVLLKNIPYTKS